MEGRSFWKMLRRMRVPKSERRPREMKMSRSFFSMSSLFVLVVVEEEVSSLESGLEAEPERRNGRLLSEM
jgi:hypothetical protein